MLSDKEDSENKESEKTKESSYENEGYNKANEDSDKYIEEYTEKTKEST